ncbi:hypothetical protein [Gayadomonas joobiniege]|uniref:hypothetical protein n=1 Tax=Gayadomonas joobiniege TaxID=1234606 RepID=UPI00035E253B|nr:hypothetical protein [Gayadomonas joobiniege]
MVELLEFIAVVLLLWFLGKHLIYRIFPEYGLRVAEKNYRRRPDHVNAKALWRARRRVKRKSSLH